MTALVKTHGQAAADALYLRFVQGYAIHVARLDPDMFEAAEPSAAALRDALRVYATRWTNPSPKTRRGNWPMCCGPWRGPGRAPRRGCCVRPKGAPEDAALGLVVQAMAQGIGQGISGSGVIQFVDPVTGLAQVTGRYLGQSQGRDALKQERCDLSDARRARAIAGGTGARGVRRFAASWRGLSLQAARRNADRIHHRGRPLGGAGCGAGAAIGTGGSAHCCDFGR